LDDVIDLRTKNEAHMSDLYEDGDRGSKPMHLIKKEGVTLAYQDINPDLPPMLFVHGWGCDHTALAPQAEFFRHSHRVVSIDLRGHGKSDAPDQDYTMAAFAHDLVWLCTELALTNPVVVGHSMGGNSVGACCTLSRDSWVGCVD
jgi:pimeloyl-ACP methyl ester carboxylesterase